eukprot:2385-Pyramimonas_sp.AAC.1
MNRRLPSSDDTIVISWNCRGVPMRSAARGLELMEADFHWEIACLQEVTDVLNVCEEIAGHRVILGPPVCGRKRRPAI